MKTVILPCVASVMLWGAQIPDPLLDDLDRIAAEQEFRIAHDVHPLSLYHEAIGEEPQSPGEEASETLQLETVNENVEQANRFYDQVM